MKSYAVKYESVEVVFDVYKKLSLKSETRTKRGRGIKRRVTGSTKTPQNWRSFLQDDSNKTELFNFIADKMCDADTTSTFIVTKGDDAISNKVRSLDAVAPCSHEKADTRVFVHARVATSRDVMWSPVSTAEGKMCMGDMECICEDATETFKKLSNCPQEVSDDDLQKLENFVVLMYDRSSAASCVNEARLDHFARKQRTYDAIPPTRAA